MMLAHLMTASHCALSTEFPLDCLCKEVVQIAALCSRYPKKFVIAFQLICCSLIFTCSSTTEVQSCRVLSKCFKCLCNQTISSYGAETHNNTNLRLFDLSVNFLDLKGASKVYASLVRVGSSGLQCIPVYPFGLGGCSSACDTQLR